MSKTTIHKAEGTWTVRAGGAVLGESRDALEVVVGDGPAVIYFPRDDIAVAFLDRSDHTTESADFGTATYYSIVTKSTTLDNAAWAYEAPPEVVSRLQGFLAFDTTNQLAVERV